LIPLARKEERGEKKKGDSTASAIFFITFKVQRGKKKGKPTHLPGAQKKREKGIPPCLFGRRGGLTLSL